MVPSSDPVGPVYGGRFAGFTIAATLAEGSAAAFIGVEGTAATPECDGANVVAASLLSVEDPWHAAIGAIATKNRQIVRSGGSARGRFMRDVVAPSRVAPGSKSGSRERATPTDAASP